MTATSHRAIVAVLVVTGMLVALFVLCCAVGGENGAAGASHTAALHVDAGHDVDDCDHAFTVFAAPVAPAHGPAPDVVASVAPAQSFTSPVLPGPAGESDRSPPLTPVPHLLCVLRT